MFDCSLRSRGARFEPASADGHRLEAVITAQPEPRAATLVINIAQ
jgi:hypothetical protein